MMSLDYPEYERNIKPKSAHLALLWWVGDKLMFISLILAILFPVALIGGQLHAHTPFNLTDYLFVPAAVFVVFAIAYLFGGYLKHLAHKKAAR